MAKYKAYPEYKDSGVEWLGAIPKDWSVTKLKYIADLLTSKSNNTDDLFVGLENISSGDGKYISKQENIADGTSVLFEKNDVLFGKLRPYLAKSWLATFSGVCSSEFLVLRTAKLHPKYLNYYSLTNEFIEQVNSSTYGSKMPRASWEFISLLPVPTCSYSLSEKVAWFLDHETAKIDNLIEKQQQLIELLKEKRQAVISHAVTKGLNPDVPMKNSGVEWLGEVPEHWDVCAIKHIVSTPITDGPHETPSFIDDGIPFISAEAISSGVIDFDKKRACISIRDHKRFSKKYSPQFNDIYMVKSGATTGITAIVETYDDFNIWSPLAVIRCNDYSNPYFVINFMRSKPFQTAIELNWSYGTQQNIGMGVIGNLHIARPPVSEAIDIATYLRAKCSKFDELIEIAMMQISIMQERRTALISAAVTGKIDVRDWVAPDTQDVEEPQEATA
ncbi:restriction endonuclease subunit S [Cronobacter turicensis]|uniref:restriction endonuclease subunit S n=1 Tax=Cronobacter turicensis TaxID=413502 RepID=UPI0013756132|nr:restriction endonuclease subunit S [Cronobacter turicensis]MEB8538521.1 restriction endonuclease subunit S [Cronobacter sakazakii]EKM0526343.1 restriction endonuclease subunit S [Cronobacter turicensis]EKY1943203.1 restriction endonuclease subunit S [Cronobacter turicensis]EKY1994149.1 restriction endonuclease subunit S [Cronobacter turicensis]ELQ5999325.1 restriction endonuclease subunit S [Cronobacter turicensis]